MNTEAEFNLIKNLKAADRADLEKITLDLSKAYNESTALNAKASIDLVTQAEALTLLANSLTKYKSVASFWFMWAAASTIGVIGLFLLLLAQ